MSETPAFLAEWLESEGKKNSAFFASLTEAQWQASVYTEGATWIVHNVLAHLLTAENNLPMFFATIRDGGSGIPDDFSLAAAIASQMQAASELTPQELIEQLKAARAKTVALVASLTAADLEKRGRHPFMGVTTLAEMIKGICIHNQIHLRDLRHSIR